MARFAEQFQGQNLVSMHSTNPEPFSQVELEQTIGQSFAEILTDVNLGFAADEGTQVLRTALAENLYASILPGQVITHAGAQEALFCAFNALLNKGDKVLAVAPIFEPLVQIPINIGCEVDYVHLNENKAWALDLDQVEQHFKAGCRLFIINFPHNPTGAMITQDELKHIIALCEKYDVWLLSDEVFRGLEHRPEYQLPAVADIYAKGISVGVISKAYAVPGIRVGWLVCKNSVLREKVLDVKGYLSICNSQVDECLATTILQKHQLLLNRNLKIILENKHLLKQLISIAGETVSINIPNAGCCAFALVNDSEALVNKIAKDRQFMLYPASLFKTDVSGVRIGFGSLKFKQFIEKIKELL